MKTQDKCYYEDFSVCTCTGSRHCDKSCVGSETCNEFITENDYFSGMMNGTIREKRAQEEDPAARRARVSKNLSLGKSKKQLKYEQRLEDEKNGVGQGYSLMDDARFKDLFMKK